MEWDDARPRQDRVVVGENLERHSVAELDARILVLEREIERVRLELEKKKAHEAKAASIFKS
jgi:uncharacterized small protein (DUF1192 family)